MRMIRNMSRDLSGPLGGTTQQCWWSPLREGFQFPPNARHRTNKADWKVCRAIPDMSAGSIHLIDKSHRVSSPDLAWRTLVSPAREYLQRFPKRAKDETD